MASLKMHKLALHVGVSGSIASTLKGGSQTSDLSTLCTLNYVRHRSACLSDSFSQHRITTISFLACRNAVGYTSGSLYLVLQNPRASLARWISSSCLLEDTSG